MNSAGKRLCLNMIVKNEMANLPRCLGAVADHIGCWVIGDTGSTDGTQDFIRGFFAERGLPGELHSFPFVNFEQARNEALERAFASRLPYDYLLFDDADMELVVEDADFRTKLEAPGYHLVQRAGSGLVYWNARLARRDAGARYRGVTHEYLDVPGGTNRLCGVWYNDHASGANRVDKFERDTKLLTEALEHDPDNVRYWFYLAQSYRDAGKTRQAADTYAKRAEMGGWAEEAWQARLQQARCLRDLGDEGGFLHAALAAYDQRPQRAEPLYDLARYYRIKGQNHASAVFSERALELFVPESDILFVEEWIYRYGLREEVSITGYYGSDKARKDRGFAACNWLALNRTIPERTRSIAHSNLHYYLEPAVKMMPSFAARPIGFVPPDGYRPTNPSITRRGDEMLLALRTVNYSIDLTVPEGSPRRFTMPVGMPVHTRNFLLRLDDGLAVRSSSEILPPQDMPSPAWWNVQGFEDMRLFVWHDELWCTTCVRELTQRGWCQQVLARIDEPSPGFNRLTDWRVLRPDGPQRHEKNWMPRVSGDGVQFIYLCDPTRLLDDQARTVAETLPPIAAGHFRGGSQAIAFDSGWLALVHETRILARQRHYCHRFIWFDAATRLQSVSRPFVFNKGGIEFAAGLAWHPDETRLVVTYGVGDSEAWIATVHADDIRGLLESAGKLSCDASGNTGSTGEAAGGRQDRPGSETAGKPATAVPILLRNGIARPDGCDQRIKALSARPPSYDRIKYWLKGESVQNFGDFLTELLLDRLFEGEPVKARRIHLIGSAISDPYVALKADEAASANGSSSWKVIFWGCGLRDEHSLSKYLRRNADFLAVRGPLTRLALDLPDTVPIGDPGLLLSTIYSPHVSEGFVGRSVCIPHFSDTRSNEKLRSLSNCNLLLRPNVDNSINAMLKFIDAIATANFVLTASLHAAIAAVAYKRPFAFWNNGFLDCPFKWRDFAASVNIECEYFASLNQARDFYHAAVAPNVRVPVLWPLLVSAPLMVRQDAFANVVAADIERHGSDAIDWKIMGRAEVPTKRLSDVADAGHVSDRVADFIGAAYGELQRSVASRSLTGADANGAIPSRKAIGA